MKKSIFNNMLEIKNIRLDSEMKMAKFSRKTQIIKK